MECKWGDKRGDCIYLLKGGSLNYRICKFEMLYSYLKEVYLKIFNDIVVLWLEFL